MWPRTHDGLLSWVRDDHAVADVRRYFAVPDPDDPTAPAFSGSRFEALGGGGDREGTADEVTADDLVAVTLLSVDVPPHVALALLEGRLGPQLTEQLRRVPREASIVTEAGRSFLADDGPLDRAWQALNRRTGMGYVTTSKLLARKRPHLVPVWDQVVRCALGTPVRPWTWLGERFSDPELPAALRRVREAAGVPATVSELRVLDVVLWTGHAAYHRRGRCPG